MHSHTSKKAGILRVFSVFLAVVLLVSVFPLASAASTSAVTTADVNLRTGPGTNYSVITTIDEGTSITVTDSSSSWYKVTVGSMSGYMYSEWISTGGSSGGSSSGGTAYVTTADVNFRTGPSTNYSVIATIDEGTEVTVLDTSNSSWYKVQIGSQTGYMTSEWLQKKGSSGSSGGSSSGGTGKQAKVNATSGLNLRATPGGSFITTLSNGTMLTILENESGGWVKVRTPSGATGYVSTEYIIYQDGGSSGGSSSGGSSSGGTAYVTTADVNFRTGPSTNYSVIATIDEGTEVTVLDTSNSSWYKVQIGSQTGYMTSEWLQKKGSSGSSGGSSSGGTGKQAKVNATSGLNLRATPGGSFITTLNNGTILTILENESGGWVKVRTPSGTTGYVSTEYIIYLDGGSATPTPSPSVSEKYVTTSDVNVRTGPSTNYDVITIIDSNVQVTVTNKSNSKWFYVTLSDGTKGYICSDYLKPVNSSKPTPSPSPSTDKYVKVNATSGLNLRESPNGNVITTLGNGTVLKVLAAASSGWMHVQTMSGVKGYVSAEYVRDYTPGAAGDVDLSTTSVTVNKYKTFYVAADTADPSALVWSSSNTSVATVNGGFIYGVSKGNATVTVKDITGATVGQVSVTVTDPESVRFAYAGPNTPAANESFDLVAVTDTEKTSVTFEIDGMGSYTTSDYTTETQSNAGYADNTVRIFKKSISLSAGMYDVNVYANSGSGSYSFDILVGSTSDKSVTNLNTKRASDELIRILADFEGFTEVVSPDTLAYNIPTVGYGYVVNENTSFYNNLTDTEGMAMLRSTVNNGSYTSSVNSFSQNNNIYMNQAQFDALVSFTYNVGPGWMDSDYTVPNLLLNTVDYSSMSMPQKATVYLSTAVYSSYNGGNQVTTAKAGTSVTVKDKYVDGNKKLWYKIDVSGKTGWVRGGNLKFSGNFKRDLNYIDAQIFAYKLSEWHQAGGQCYVGLLDRRVAEAKIFLYGNYAEATKTNPNYGVNTYDFQYPDCMKEYE